VHDIKKDFYKKFLYEPFPVESRWDPSLWLQNLDNACCLYRAALCRSLLILLWSKTCNTGQLKRGLNTFLNERKYSSTYLLHPV
jgi:hypothetical protein